MRFVGLILLVSAFLFSCGGGRIQNSGPADEAAEKTQFAQVLGDFASGIDDAMSAGAGMPFQFPGSCSSQSFSGCSSAFRVKSLSSCNTSSNDFLNGTINLSFFGAGSGSCSFGSSGAEVLRAPQYSRVSSDARTRNIMSVSSGGGYRVTRGATTSTATISNVLRQQTIDNALALSISVNGVSAFSISGIARESRILSGGNIQLFNSLTGTTCNVSAQSMGWNSQCKCPTSGSFVGTCSSGGSFELLFDFNCGVGSLIENGSSQSVQLTACEI